MSICIREILDIRFEKLGEITYTIQSPNYDKRCNIFLEVTRKSDGWYGKYVTNPELVKRKKEGKGLWNHFVIEKDVMGRTDFQFLDSWLEKTLS